MYRFLSIEDDPLEEEALARCVQRYAEEAGLDVRLDWWESVRGGGLERLAGSYDLILMDIDLPGENGLDASAALRGFDQVTPLVFVTNLARYAVRGYEVDALDFIVKPVEYDNFALRMDRVMRCIERRPARRVVIRTADGLHLVRSSDIAYVEVRGHRLDYHVAGWDEPLSARGTMRGLEEELAGEPFVRVSNEALVSLAHIVRLRGDGVGVSTGEVLYFSRPRKRAALEKIARYLGEGRTCPPSRLTC